MAVASNVIVACIIAVAHHVAHMQHVVAYMPNPLVNGRASSSFLHSTVSSSTFGIARTLKSVVVKATDEDGADVSIPDDAAARLAYDEWRSQNNKGDFDEQRFANFKANYEAIAVANVIAKKQAREAGENIVPMLLALNEYADCNEDEYQAKMVSGRSTGDVLGKAFQAAQSQSEASNALAEAAEALAEDEELLAQQLGLESIEELEVALDSLEGIAEDGGELEKENIAREARIRSAYLEWCKESGKEPNESRFATFSVNFLAMETYARESGRELSLNKYADCTEEEYLEATGQKQKEDVRNLRLFDETAAAEEDAARRAASDALAEAQKREEVARKAREEEMAKKRASQEAWQAMTDEERKLASEKDREARRAAQAKAIEKLRQETEAAAIAAAKAARDKEAAQIAMRRELEDKAEERLRQQARQLEEKQQLSAKVKQPQFTRPLTKSKPFEPFSFFASSVASKKSDENVVEDVPAFNISSLLGGISPSPSTQPKKEEPSNLLSSILGTLQQGKERQSTKKDSKQLAAPENSPKPQKTQPKSDVFSFFAAVAPKPAAPQRTLSPKRAPAPLAPKSAPAPPAVKQTASPAKSSPKAASVLPPATKSNIFSLFASPPTTPAPKPESKPVTASPAPPAEKSSLFSIFGSSVTKQTLKAEPKGAPVPSSSPPAAKSKNVLSFLGSPATPKATPKSEPPKPASASPPKTAFSFFSGTAVPKQDTARPVPPATVKPAPKAAAKAEPSFSLFGMQKPVSDKAPTPKKSESKKVGRSADSSSQREVRGTISLTQLAKDEEKLYPFSFFSSRTEAQDDIPALSRWIQNEDGSITGFVTNSKNFRDNTRITTSPVRKGVKKGQVVKTGSGSRYRLN